MVVAAVAALVGLLAVLVALLRDERLPAPAPPSPAWLYLPDPSDVARAEFPLAFPGYDCAAVDAHLDAVARVWADMLAVAPRDVLDRARVRVAARLGHETSPVPPTPPPVSAVAGTDSGSDEEALRTEAALGGLDAYEGEPRAG